MAFTYYYTVRFQDTDAAGVVYFTNMLRICHEGYEVSLVATGINIKSFFTNPSVAFPIVHANVDFFRPVYCGDNLMINLSPHKIAVDKFEIPYEITVGEVIVAKAITRHVCIDIVSRTKQELPTYINHWLEANRKDTEGSQRRKSRQEVI
ncbi:MAG: acyl-CoA thioesterase [Cuspidothrix sp.]